MATKFISINGLTHFYGKVKDLFVKKELKTGSMSEYKVLSDNNLTDELKQKILDAGSSSFTGAYTDLTGKPSIEGHEIASGNQTATSLGLATPNDITTATAGLASESWVTEKGYQTADNVNTIINGKGYQTAQQVESSITAKGYQTAQQVTTAVTNGTKGLASETWVTQKGYDTVSSVDGKVSAAKTELSQAINTAVASVWKAKGSTAFASLPEITMAAAGDVWNITDAFTTTENFVEGAGKKYPVGTNVACIMVADQKKWDVLAGVVDLTPYLLKTDMVPITNEEIDALFA